METVEAKIAIVDCERLAACSKSIDLRPFKSLEAIYFFYGGNSYENSYEIEMFYNPNCDIFNVFLDSPAEKFPSSPSGHLPTQIDATHTISIFVKKSKVEFSGY